TRVHQAGDTPSHTIVRGSRDWLDAPVDTSGDTLVQPEDPSATLVRQPTPPPQSHKGGATLIAPPTVAPTDIDDPHQTHLCPPGEEGGDAQSLDLNLWQHSRAPSLPPEKHGQTMIQPSAEDVASGKASGTQPAIPPVPGYEILKELGRGGMG